MTIINTFFIYKFVKFDLQVKCLPPHVTNIGTRPSLISEGWLPDPFKVSG